MKIAFLFDKNNNWITRYIQENDFEISDDAQLDLTKSIDAQLIYYE